MMKIALPRGSAPKNPGIYNAWPLMQYKYRELEVDMQTRVRIKWNDQGRIWNYARRL